MRPPFGAVSARDHWSLAKHLRISTPPQGCPDRDGLGHRPAAALAAKAMFLDALVTARARDRGRARAPREVAGVRRGGGGRRRAPARRAVASRCPRRRRFARPRRRWCASATTTPHHPAGRGRRSCSRARRCPRRGAGRSLDGGICGLVTCSSRAAQEAAGRFHRIASAKESSAPSLLRTAPSTAGRQGRYRAIKRPRPLHGGGGPGRAEGEAFSVSKDGERTVLASTRDR